MLPDDPPIPLTEEIQGWRNMPDVGKGWVWSVWHDDDTLVASADIWISCVDNLHLAEFDVKVAPECRRQGLARQLLPLISARAALEDRRLLKAETYDLVPAGISFMQRLGAQKGLEGHVNHAEPDIGLWRHGAMSMVDLVGLCPPPAMLQAVIAFDQVPLSHRLHDITNAPPLRVKWFAPCTIESASMYTPVVSVCPVGGGLA